MTEPLPGMPKEPRVGIDDFRAMTLDAIVEILPGMAVRSYDFEFSNRSWVEGVVQETTGPIEGCMRYRIAATARVTDGVYTPLEAEMLPPVNGTPHAFGGFTNGVRPL
jgi:hypothetical protein